MSGGGRIGWDAPYSTRGCGMEPSEGRGLTLLITWIVDMQWFTTSEICRILHKFDRIHIIGDSMMRTLAQAFHVLLREDLVSGGRMPGRSDEPEGVECRCRMLLRSACAFWSALNTDMVRQEDPTSIHCGVEQRPASIFCKICASAQRLVNLLNHS